MRGWCALSKNTLNDAQICKTIKENHALTLKNHDEVPRCKNGACVHSLFRNTDPSWYFSPVCRKRKTHTHWCILCLRLHVLCISHCLTSQCTLSLSGPMRPVLARTFLNHFFLLVPAISLLSALHTHTSSPNLSNIFPWTLCEAPSLHHLDMSLKCTSIPSGNMMSHTDHSIPTTSICGFAELAGSLCFQHSHFLARRHLQLPAIPSSCF